MEQDKLRIENTFVNKVQKKPVMMDNVLFTISIKRLALTTVALPLISMFLCFVISILFHFTIVTTTICSPKVFNFCPSVSAITGISPQQYIWRVGVALHCTPRLLLSWLYHGHHTNLAVRVTTDQRPLYLRLVNLNFWTNVAEILALVGVTYISNRDNYPVHEKIFILFMASSIAYMLGTCACCKMAQSKVTSDMERRSWIIKCCLFILIALCSIAMTYFFYRHRVYCQELAFSWFAMLEYVICFANMCFHATIMWDLRGQELVIGLPSAGKDD
ncbi:hypothetical protein LAZ67_1008322 [Cordylochernes scorpioides]|uniref:CWH43-like N-terminal domain-containing protein n=1 Tax=Cordylochernes scorpioides TaxID=51811 RepID=A0ABY6K1N3_9ARAC|nr:hypothetical protein LAZ67_1008322 [Cordylochernes scorpioides]